MVAAIYDTLMVPNTKDVMVPYLAKSVTHDAAYTTWTIVLRDGIKFQDGSAARRHRRRQQHRSRWTEEHALIGAAFTNIASITATDPTTVTVTTKVPWVDVRRRPSSGRPARHHRARPSSTAPTARPR